MVETAEIHQGAGLERATLGVQRHRQDCGARVPDGLQRRFGLAVHQIDGGQIGRDLGLGHALQPVLDLVFEQLGGLVQQVDIDQTARQAADHLVAVGADGGQFAEVVEQAQRLHRLETVGPALKEEHAEGGAEICLDLCGALEAVQIGPSPLQGCQGLTIEALRQIELAQLANDRQFGGVAAPAPAQAFQLIGRRIGLHRPLGQGQADDAQFGGHRDGVQRRAGDGGVDGQGAVGLTIQFEQSGLHQAGGQLVGGGGVLAEAVGQQGAGGVEVAGLQSRHGVGGAEARAPGGGKLIYGRGAGGEGLTRGIPVALGRGDIAAPDGRSRVGRDGR